MGLVSGAFDDANRRGDMECATPLPPPPRDRKNGTERRFVCPPPRDVQFGATGAGAGFDDSHHDAPTTDMPMQRKEPMDVYVYLHVGKETAQQTPRERQRTALEKGRQIGRREDINTKQNREKKKKEGKRSTRSNALHPHLRGITRTSCAHHAHTRRLARIRIRARRVSNCAPAPSIRVRVPHLGSITVCASLSVCACVSLRRTGLYS